MPDKVSSSAHTTEMPAKRQYRKGEERRREILTAVVDILARPEQERFTTKEIAACVGVSEAALYRHFSGKAEILGELVVFCETAIKNMFSEIDGAVGVTMTTKALAKVRSLLLFAEANPGLARLLTGEAFIYEEPASAQSMRYVITMAEDSIRRTLKLAAGEKEIVPNPTAAQRAAFFMSFVEGRWRRFTQSGFQEAPSADWQAIEMQLGASALSGTKKS